MMTDVGGGATTLTFLVVTTLSSKLKVIAALIPNVITKSMRDFLERETTTRDDSEKNAAIPARGPTDMTVVQARAAVAPETAASAWSILVPEWRVASTDATRPRNPRTARSKSKEVSTPALAGELK
jgi:hypothetical protein